MPRLRTCGFIVGLSTSFLCVSLSCGGDDDHGSPRDAGSDATADAGTLACGTYCELVSRNCTGQNAQYASQAACERTCGLFPAPFTAETNTAIGCRYAHAAAAQAQPDLECGAAGPYAAGKCGDRCDVFCDLALAVCNGKDGARPHASFDECKLVCEAYARTADKKVSPAGPSSGNTRECRMYHLLAAVESPALHCPHVGSASPVCMDAPDPDGGADAGEAGARDGGEAGANGDADAADGGGD